MDGLGGLPDMKYCSLARMMASRARRRRNDMSFEGVNVFCTVV